MQTTIHSSAMSRSFDCFPVAVIVILVNDRDEILLMSHPRRKGLWEVINGSMQAGEDILAACKREMREEIGAAAIAEAVGIVHAFSFHYDVDVQHMLSIAYVMRYVGGEIIPGDDMNESIVQWASIADIENKKLNIIIPADCHWIFRRAVDMKNNWRIGEIDLQPTLQIRPPKIK